MQKNLKKFPLLLFVLITILSCSSEDEAVKEDEFFRINVDGKVINLTYQNSIDISKDKSVFVSGGLYPDYYSVNVVAVDLKGVGSITGAKNPEGYSIKLGIFSNPDRDLTSYYDSDDTSKSEIIITRNDNYIEGSFSGNVTESFSSKPEIKFISGSFKILND